MYSSLNDALLRKLDENRLSTSQLKVWETSCTIVNQLLDIVKIVNLPRVFPSFMKVSSVYGLTTACIY